MLFNFLTKRILLYTAFGQDNYFRIAAKLDAAGVKYRTKVANNHRQRTFNSQPNTQYDIYVKKEDELRAVEAINRKD